jgi:MtN3 and saliva related transmembrane protein
MELITLIGVTAGALTTASFFPQVVKTWRSRHTKDISAHMFGLLFLGILLWTVYGVLRADFPVILANGISLVLVSVMLVFKLRYG